MIFHALLRKPRAADASLQARALAVLLICSAVFLLVAWTQSRYGAEVLITPLNRAQLEIHPLPCETGQTTPGLLLEKPSRQQTKATGIAAAADEEIGRKSAETTKTWTGLLHIEKEGPRDFSLERESSATVEIAGVPVVPAASSAGRLAFIRKGFYPITIRSHGKQPVLLSRIPGEAYRQIPPDAYFSLRRLSVHPEEAPWRWIP